MITAHANTFDARDALALAGFWSEALGQPIDEGGSELFASIGIATESPGNGRWMFIQVPEGKSAKNRMHVDFVVAGDLEAEVERLVALGATRGETHRMDEESLEWVCLTDPEGNEFDVASNH